MTELAPSTPSILVRRLGGRGLDRPVSLLSAFPVSPSTIPHSARRDRGQRSLRWQTVHAPITMQGISPECWRRQPVPKPGRDEP